MTKKQIAIDQNNLKNVARVRSLLLSPLDHARDSEVEERFWLIAQLIAENVVEFRLDDDADNLATLSVGFAQSLSEMLQDELARSNSRHQFDFRGLRAAEPPRFVQALTRKKLAMLVFGLGVALRNDEKYSPVVRALVEFNQKHCLVTMSDFPDNE